LSQFLDMLDATVSRGKKILTPKPTNFVVETEDRPRAFVT